MIKYFIRYADLYLQSHQNHYSKLLKVNEAVLIFVTKLENLIDSLVTFLRLNRWLLY